MRIRDWSSDVCSSDLLVFDGASFALNADHSVAAQLPAFEEAVEVTEWRRQETGWTCAPARREPPESGMEPIYRALMLGLRDYVNKNRFPGVILGLSGGIDSALTAAVAVDARSEEHTSELQSLIRISYAVFCLKKKNKNIQ